jgi:hypothetical protein
MKSQLYKLQTDFAAAIRYKDHDAIQALPINETNGISKDTRLEVYSFGYWLRLSRSIREDFTRVHEKLGDEADTIHRRFFIETKPGFHLLGEVSIAFALYITQIRPELKTEAALDMAVLISEMTPWIYLFESKEANILRPQDLGEYEPHEISLLWNTSLHLIETQIVLQKNHETAILRPDPTVLALINSRNHLKTLRDLLEKLESLNFSELEASNAIAFLTANEILFFSRN